MTFREKVSSVYYTHGLFCASHPLTVFFLTFSFVFLCVHPLSKLPLPGHAPLQHTTPTRHYTVPDHVTQSPSNNHDVTMEQRPIWYAGPSAGYVLQIVVKATVSPWEREKLFPSDAFRTPLMKAFDVVEIVEKLQVRQGKTSLDISELCLQVSETLPDRHVTKLLPQYNCMIVSPANIWHLDRETFDTDGELVKTVYKIAHTLDKTPLLKDILFGVPWPETGMSRFYMRNRQRVISFAVTVVMKKYDANFLTKLEEQLKVHYPQQHDSNATTVGEEMMTHVYFKARNYFFLEHTPLIVAYVVLFLYIYFSVRKIEMVKSKWGLALASVATVVASLLMSIGICTFFGLQPILLGARIYEIFPYLVVIVGLENVLILTKSVVSTPVHMDVKYRVAEGLYKEGWGITKNLLYELLILLAGFFTFVPEIQEFCLFACVGLLSDFFLQMMFFSTVLGIDIRRMELTDLRSQNASSVVTGNEIKHPPPIINCPYRQSRSPSRRRMERSRSFPHAGSINDRIPSQTSSNRLRLIEYIARYRMVQRLLMLATAVWIGLILYQTGLAAHMIYVSMNQTETNENPHSKVTLRDDVIKYDERDLDAMLAHDNVDHWTKLSHAHWPTLFGFYNISLWNRYITILPPVRLSIAVKPEIAVKYRHPEETKSKLDWLPPAPQTSDWLPPTDWLPPVPDSAPDNPTKQLLLQAKRFYPRTRREFYVTVALAVASTLIIAYLMVALYGCMCSRNYSKWRAGWSEAEGRGRRRYSESRVFTPGAAVPLTGHVEDIECLACNGQLVVSTSLSADIRVWDSLTGRCLTVIDSSRSLEPTYTCQDDLLLPTDKHTDFHSGGQVKQDPNPELGYDFMPFCNNGGYESNSKTRVRSRTIDAPREVVDQRTRSYSADSQLTGRSLSAGNAPAAPHRPERQAQIWSLVCQDSLIAAGCSDGKVELWDCMSGQLKCTYNPPLVQNIPPQHCRLRPLTHCSNDGVTHLLLLGSRLIVGRLDGRLDFLLLETYVAASVASGPSQQKIYMRGHLRKHSGTWRTDSQGLGSQDLITCSLITGTRAHSRALSGLRSEGGRVVSVSLDTSIKVYKLDDCMCLYTLHGHEAPVTALCLDEQSPLGAITGCSKGTVLVWDLLTGACVHKLVNSDVTRRQPIIGVLCTPGYVLSTQENNDLCIWDRCRGLMLHTIRLDYVTCSSLSMLTSHLLVCASGEGDLQVWDISKPSLVHHIPLHGTRPAHTVLTVGNALAICDLGNQVKVVPFPSGLGKGE